jgi:ATP-grasp domain, R2K clade family 2
MKTTGLNLLISDKPDLERDSVAESFASHGGAVHRIGRFWDPPVFDPPTVRVYGADSFCLVLQQKLGLSLCSPDDQLLLRAPFDYLKRQITHRVLAESSAITFPSFVKPVVPKQFRGAVYRSSTELAAECRDLSPDAEIFVSESVAFSAEARTFVLDGRVLDTAVYEGEREEAGAGAFVTALARAISLPLTVVVDVGFIVGQGWAVIEFNSAWGSGLNGCDPEKVLPAIIAASDPGCNSNFATENSVD